MSYYAMVVIVEADDAERAKNTPALAAPRGELVYTSEPWEVVPDNDLAAEQAAGKWVAVGESGRYYPWAEPEFSADGAFEQMS